MGVDAPPSKGGGGRPGPLTWRRPTRFLIPVGIGLAAVLAFAAVLPGGRFVFDDHVLIDQNTDLRSGDIWWSCFARDYYGTSAQVGTSGYYRPVAVLANAIDTRVWGDRASGYHLTNLLLHAVASALLAPALVALGAPAGIAALSALLFAVHPVHAESVAFVSGRVDVLAGIGIFAALALAASPALFAAVGLALAALFAFHSKEVAVVLPLLLVLVWAARPRDDEERRGPSGLALTLATAGAALVSILTRYAALGTLLPASAHGPRRVGTAFLPVQTVGFALASIYAPMRRLFLEPHPDLLSPVRVAVGALVAVLLWAAAARVDPAARGFLRRCGLAAVIALLPVLNVLPQETELSERFLYVASGFAIVPAAVLVAAAWRRRGPWQPASAGGCALAIVLLLGISAWRARAWRDDVVLWRIAVREEPGRVAFWDRLGLALTEQRNLGPAEEALRRAVALDPKYFNAQVNLGVLLSLAHRPREAIEVYRKALEIDPKHVNTHLDVGLAMMDIGQLEQARHEFETAVALKPDNPEARRLAGIAALQLGQLEDARRHLEVARRILPGDPSIEQVWHHLEVLERRARREPAPAPPRGTAPAPPPGPAPAPSAEPAPTPPRRR